MKLFRVMATTSASVLFLMFLIASDSIADSEWRACVLTNDPPRSQRNGSTGFDLDILQSLAERMDLTLQLVWIANDIKIIEIEDTDLPIPKLVKGICDVVPSVLGVEALGVHENFLTLSAPYYGVAFELIGSERLPTTLEALGKVRVAVQLQTIAHYALQALGILWTARTSNKEVVAALERGEVDAALVWGPDLAILGLEIDTGFLPPPGLRWNGHLALIHDDPHLETINSVLFELIQDGTIASLAHLHGIPSRSPFDVVSTVLTRHAIGLGSGHPHN